MDSAFPRTLHIQGTEVYHAPTQRSVGIWIDGAHVAINLVRGTVTVHQDQVYTVVNVTVAEFVENHPLGRLVHQVLDVLGES